MKLVKKDFICPYCFSKQDLYRIKFRCQNTPAKCSPEVDNDEVLVALLKCDSSDPYLYQLLLKQILKRGKK